MPSDWSLGYPRYMIEDGCPEIERGQILEWPALEFYTEATLAICETRSRSAFEVDDYRYLFLLKSFTCRIRLPLSILDSGRFGQGICCLPNAGKAISSVAIFMLDSRFVRRSFQTKSTRHWHIAGMFVAIFADLTPLIEHRDDTGRSWFTRDCSQIRYKEISATKALSAQAYVLRCRPRMQ